MAAVVSVRSGKQLRAAVSLVKLCCFLYFLSVSESRALRASAANVLLSGFLTKPRCQSFPKGPVRWLCPDWPLLSSLPFVFSQTESLPNAGSSSQEHWLSTGTPEQPFVASWKERFVPRERLPLSRLGLSGWIPRQGGGVGGLPLGLQRWGPSFSGGNVA